MADKCFLNGALVKPKRVKNLKDVPKIGSGVVDTMLQNKSISNSFPTPSPFLQRPSNQGLSPGFALAFWRFILEGKTHILDQRNTSTTNPLFPGKATYGYESKLCMERSALFRTYCTKGFRNWSCSGPLECDEIKAVHKYKYIFIQ